VDPQEEKRLVKGKHADQSAPSARRGYSLIETIVVITGVGIILGGSALLLQLLMRLNTSTMDRYSAAVALDRLARQLRDDVHGCERAELVPLEKAQGSPAGLRLRIEADHLITYEPRPGSVVRNETRSGKRVRHEAYTVPRGRAARFEQRDFEGIRLVAFVVYRLPGPSGTDPPRPLEVVAMPRKHRTGPIHPAGGKP
jgi:hypothetical protein